MLESISTCVFENYTGPEPGIYAGSDLVRFLTTRVHRSRCPGIAVGIARRRSRLPAQSTAKGRNPCLPTETATLRSHGVPFAEGVQSRGMTLNRELLSLFRFRGVLAKFSKSQFLSSFSILNLVEGCAERQTRTLQQGSVCS